jgi:hypothetical protein
MNSLTSQLLTTLAWTLPFGAVMIAGIVAALVRWRRHPAVSALLVISLSVWLLASLTDSLAVPLVIINLGAASISREGLYLGILGIGMGVIRAMVWAAIIVATLGWRNSTGEQIAPIQFSIRGLIAVTLAVAVVCALMRAVVSLLGDVSPLPLQLLLQLVDDIPVIVCLGIGIWTAAVRWRLHPQVSHVAIWALALALAVIIVPQMFVVGVVVSPSRPLSLLTSINTLVSIGGMVTSVVSCSLAIAAALGWRGPETSSRDRSAFLSGDAADGEGLGDDVRFDGSRTPA